MEPWAGQKAGVPTGYGGPWQDGVAAIFQFLRRSAKQVTFISDTPYPRTLSAGLCGRSSVRRAPMQPTSGATQRSCRRSRRQSFGSPSRSTINSIDPTSWFCTPKVCPVIVGNLLVYHDKSHMTPQWSRFIAPVLSAALPRIM